MKLDEKLAAVKMDEELPRSSRMAVISRPQIARSTSECEGQ